MVLKVKNFSYMIIFVEIAEVGVTATLASDGAKLAAPMRPARTMRVRIGAARPCGGGPIVRVPAVFPVISPARGGRTREGAIRVK